MIKGSNLGFGVIYHPLMRTFVYVRVQNRHCGSFGTERCHVRSFCIVWLSDYIVCRSLPSTVQSNGIPLDADDIYSKSTLPTVYTETIFTLYVGLIPSRKHDGAGMV